MDRLILSSGLKKTPWGDPWSQNPGDHQVERLRLSGGLKNLYYSKLLLGGGLKKAPQEDPWSQKSPSGTSETLRWS